RRQAPQGLPSFPPTAPAPPRRTMNAALPCNGPRGPPTTMSIDSILGPGGAVAGLLDRYEPRPQQLDMAHAVERAIAHREHLLVEAGTGVGKSFAYLIPAVLAALADRKCRAVISTHT